MCIYALVFATTIDDLHTDETFLAVILVVAQVGLVGFLVWLGGNHKRIDGAPLWEEEVAMMSQSGGFLGNSGSLNNSGGLTNSSQMSALAGGATRRASTKSKTSGFGGKRRGTVALRASPTQTNRAGVMGSPLAEDRSISGNLSAGSSQGASSRASGGRQRRMSSFGG